MLIIQQYLQAMSSNYVLHDNIEVNISEFKKGVTVIDYVDKVIAGVHTRPADRGSILGVLCVELIVGGVSKAKVERMKKKLVVNGQTGLDLKNKNTTIDSDKLFYKNFKL